MSEDQPTSFETRNSCAKPHLSVRNRESEADESEIFLSAQRMYGITTESAGLIAYRFSAALLVLLQLVHC